MSHMEGMRMELDSCGLVDAPSDTLWENANRRMEVSPVPARDVYEVRPRKDRDGFDLISDRLRRGPIWYAGPDAVRNAVAYAKYRSPPGRIGRLFACSTNSALQSRRTNSWAIFASGKRIQKLTKM